MRKTQHVLAVARVLMADPDAEHWGYEITCRSGVASGALHPILRRFRDAGWMEDHWEVGADVVGRPLRRYYVVTEIGALELGKLAAEVPLGITHTA